MPGDHVTVVAPYDNGRDIAKFVEYSLTRPGLSLVRYVPGGYALVPNEFVLAGWPAERFIPDPFVVKAQTIAGTFAPLNGEHREYTADDAMQAALRYLEAHPDTPEVRIYNLRHLEEEYAVQVTRDLLGSIRPEEDA